MDLHPEFLAETQMQVSQQMIHTWFNWFTSWWPAILLPVGVFLCPALSFVCPISRYSSCLAFSILWAVSPFSLYKRISWSHEYSGQLYYSWQFSMIFWHDDEDVPEENSGREAFSFAVLFNISTLHLASLHSRKVTVQSCDTALSLLIFQ